MATTMKSTLSNSLTPLERLIIALLDPYIRLLCLKEPQLAFDEHNSFVGKQRLKDGIIGRLPMQELEDVGLKDQNVRVLMNEMLKSRNNLTEKNSTDKNLTDFLIKEAKRRKEEQDGDGVSGGSSPVSRSFPLFRSSTLDIPMMENSSFVSPSQDCPQSPYEHIHRRTRSFESPNPNGNNTSFGSYSFLSPISPIHIPFSPVYPPPPGGGECSPPQPPQSTTPIHISLQHHLLTFLQHRLELACYHFTKSYYPSIFWRKSTWESSPLATELTQWAPEIIKELRKHHPTGNNINVPINPNHCPEEAVHELESLISILREFSNIRHDAVHRNNVSTEKILRYVRLGIHGLKMFRAWGGGATGSFSAYGRMQSWQDEVLGQVLQEMEGLEEKLETLRYKFQEERVRVRRVRVEEMAGEGMTLKRMEMDLRWSQAHEEEDLLRRLTWDLWEVGRDSFASEWFQPGTAREDFAQSSLTLVLEEVDGQEMTARSNCYSG